MERGNKNSAKYRRLGPVLQNRRLKPTIICLLLGMIVITFLAFWVRDQPGKPSVMLMPALSGDVLAGQQLFKAHCAVCHGDNAGGTDKGPPLIHRIYRPAHHSNFAFIRAVSMGVVQHHWQFGSMPPLPQVSKDEIERMILFVREVQRANRIR